ncbi:transglycosylase domain-containing protein [Nonomuraea sp. NPDC049152]|uniref:transglycosylase domain-containing protein n=1 Tax=Nonomuraea sp. NPDC049152 TaxID=3154350 RepID=UPI0033D03A96
MQAQGKDQSNPIVNVVRLLAAGTAAGVLAAAVALPAVGGVGLTAKSTTETLALRPEKLDEPPLPERTEIYDASGKQVAQFYYQNRESVKIDQIAPVMRTAIISIEDFRFYEHGAIDLEGTARAMAKNVTGGGVVQGGSSITQQYVKLVQFNKAKTKKEAMAAIAPTVNRKLNELRYAMAIEEKYTKDEILEKYLNISYFGAGAYGIQAAAKRFFGKSASDLDLSEAATLAGAVQNPVRTDPMLGKTARDNLLNRRNTVLDRMAELKKITLVDAAAAKKEKLGFKGTKIPGGCEESKYPYFCLYVKNEILTNPDFGATPEDREKLLQQGGLRIKTTLDPKMQAASEEAIKKYVFAKDKPAAAQAIVVPGTGEIKALAASRKFGDNKKKNETLINLAADSKHGGGVGFQQGSTAKAFTLAAALENGWKIDDGNSTGKTYDVPPVENTPFRDCKGLRVGSSHQVFNSSEGGGGFKTLRTGTLGSVNTFFMKLEEQVGLCKVVKMAEKLGIKRADGGKLQQVPTFTLGVNEMDPVTVSNAFAVFASRGQYCRPMAITEVRDRTGKVTAAKPKCKQVIDEDVADAVSEVMSGVFTKGTMSEVGGIGRDAAGKTGTTDGYTAAWFAGYTPNLASAVSLGDPRGAFNHDLTGVTIGGRFYAYVYGASISGRIWKDSMIKALKGIEATSFAPYDSSKYGGCTKSCAPKPPKRDKDGDRGDRGDNPFGNPDDQQSPLDIWDTGDDNGGNGPTTGNGRDKPITPGRRR